MTGPGSPGHRAGTPVAARVRDDAGGLWIRVGITLGIVFYLFMVVLWAAGFTPIAPFVVLPPVIVGLIGANALLGGPRRRQDLPPRPIAPPGPGGPAADEPDPAGTDAGGTGAGT
jgi:hypothetical protein